MVDFRKIPKIDAHIHLMPADIIEKYPDSKFSSFGSVDSYIRLMDKYNIKKAFIMPFNDPAMLALDNRLETANDKLIEMVGGYRGRLYFFADLDINRSLEENIGEIKRIRKDKNFLGVKIHPNNTGYPVDGKFYKKVSKFLEKEEILTEIHSYPRRTIKDDVSAPVRIKNLKKSCPSLKTSLAHLGGFQYEELVNFEGYLNISAILTDLVGEFGLGKTEKILRGLGLNRLVFASDYPDNRKLAPGEIYESYFDILSQMGFSYGETRMIAYENAMRMVGLKII